MKKLLITILLLGLTGCTSTNIDNSLGATVDLKLEANKENILYSEEVDNIICDKNNINCEKIGEIKRYKYKTDTKVSKGFIVKDKKTYSEREDLRTGNTRIYQEELLGGEVENNTFIGKFYSSDIFVKDGTDWYKVDVATTTVENFNEQTKVTLIDRVKGLFSRSALADDFAGESGDGVVYNYGNCTWANIFNGTCGTKGKSDDGTLIDTQLYSNGSTVNQCNRGFLAFDTSAIGAGSTITSATFTGTNFDHLGTSIIHAVEGTQPSVSGLTTDDWGEVGDVSYGSQDTFSANTEFDIGFNQTGKDNVSKTSYTKIAIREYRDLSGAGLPGAGQNTPRFYTTENATEAYRPYLTVVFEAGGATGSKKIRSINFN